MPGSMGGDIPAVYNSAFGSVDRIERMLTRHLVMRQIRRGPYFKRELAKYGPRGAVRICVARAFQAYLTLAALSGCIFSFAGLTIPAAICLGTTMVFGALVSRTCSWRGVPAWSG